jgi:hypothetical protein
MMGVERGYDDHHRFHTPGTLQAISSETPLRAPGKISAAMPHPIFPAALAHELPRHPDSARLPHGKNAVRPAHPMPLKLHHARLYRRDFDRLTTLELYNVHPPMIYRRQESKGAP